MNMTESVPALRLTDQPAPAARDAQIRAAAEKLETTFLTEMLRAAGAATTRSSFGGGAGEEQFASFLLEAQAKEMVRAGGIGLAQSLYEAMQGRGADAG